MPYAAADSIWTTISSLGYYFNNHVLYSLLCRFSIQIMGTSEVAARVPALLMGLLGIAALFCFGKKFISSAAGLLAALLLAVSAAHIDHSSEARGYSGFALFSILSSFYYLSALKTNSRKYWVPYVICTVLGLYMHVCMILVVLSQFFYCVVLGAWRTIRVTTKIQTGTLKKYYIYLVCAGILTLIIYSPILVYFLKNMGKISIVAVDRIPFIVNLLNYTLPGSITVPGCILYTAFFLTGLFFVMKHDPLQGIYYLVLLFLPVSIYLFINPMFVFERYFIFLVPVSLLTVSTGITDIGDRISKNITRGAVFTVPVLAVLLYLNSPYTYDVVTRDRQNYREAARYVTGETQKQDGNYGICAIGHAGAHFQYYTSVPILIPKTFDEFTRMLEGKKYVWCLISAWLPSLRPLHEDRALYSELPEHEKIYDYVIKNFSPKKEYPCRFPTKIYLFEK